MEIKTREEAAEYLGMSLASFKNNVQKHIPQIKIGRLVKFDVKDLDAFLESKKIGVVE